MVLCLVEGVDCCGKSTLVDALRAELYRVDPTSTVDVLHRGPPTRHPLDEYATPLLDYRPGRGQHVLCDRWHVGESVYPVVFDRPTRLDDAVRTYVELLLRSRGALVVHCVASTAYVVRCLFERGDAVVRPVHVPALKAGFAAAETRSLLPWRRAVVGTADPVALVAEARRLEHAVSALGDYVTYVGPPDPALLLLGDRRGPVQNALDAYGTLPAFVPRPATSGHWLLTALATHAPEIVRSLGVANANDVDDAERLWRTLGRPPTVALGRRAAATALFADRVVDHPQCARRFRYHFSNDYVRELLGNA